MGLENYSVQQLLDELTNREEIRHQFTFPNAGIEVSIKEGDFTTLMRTSGEKLIIIYDLEGVY